MLKGISVMERVPRKTNRPSCSLCSRRHEPTWICHNTVNRNDHISAQTANLRHCNRLPHRCMCQSRNRSSSKNNKWRFIFISAFYYIFQFLCVISPYTICKQTIDLLIHILAYHRVRNIGLGIVWSRMIKCGFRSIVSV